MPTLLGMSVSSGSGYDGFAPWIVYMRNDETNMFWSMKESVRTAYADEVVGTLCLTALTAAAVGKRERTEYMDPESKKENCLSEEDKKRRKSLREGGCFIVVVSHGRQDVTK